MIRRPPRSTRTDTSFPTRRSSDLDINAPAMFQNLFIKAAHAILVGKIQRQRKCLAAIANDLVRCAVGAFNVYVANDNLGAFLSKSFGTSPPDSRCCTCYDCDLAIQRSEEHTSELQSLMRTSSAAC